MKIAGNIELINGKIINLRVEDVSELDTNDTTRPNHLIVYESRLYFNDGNGFKLVQLTSADSNSSLINILGNEWINEDLSFNPNNLNQFNNIDGLTADDSLFTVLQQLDQAISNVTQSSITDLTDVLVSNLETGNILVSIDQNLINISLETAIKNYGNVRIQDLKDFEKTNQLVNNDILIWDNENSKITNKRCFYKTENNVNTNSYTVTHGLGTQYCFVEVIDKLTNTKISSNDYTITYDTNNSLSIIINYSTVAEIIVFSL